MDRVRAKDNLLSVLVYAVPALLGLAISTLTFPQMFFASSAIMAAWAIYVSRDECQVMIMVSIFPFTAMIAGFAVGMTIRILS